MLQVNVNFKRLKCKFYLKYSILFTLLFLLIYTSAYSQEELQPVDQASVKRLEVSDELKINQFVKKLNVVLSSKDSEALPDFFLLGDKAQQYAAFVYQGTEIGQYEFQLKGVVDFYQAQSKEALNYFANIDAPIKSLEVNDIKIREGATERMQVYVVRLNVFFEEAAPFSFRVNLVETPNALAILNLKN